MVPSDYEKFNLEGISG